MFFVASALPSRAQRKEPRNNVKVKMKNGREDPWADYKEERDSIGRWAYGINFGGYFANKYSANFYNGTPGNLDSLGYIWRNKDWYQDIKIALHSVDKVIVLGYPTNMHYQVALTAGVFLRYNFDRKNGIFLQADYSLLKAEDVITVEVDPKEFLTLPDIRQIPIAGREERAMLALGFQRSFPLKSKLYFFIDGGAMMCYSHVKKFVLVVEGKEYNMINVYGKNKYQQGVNNQEFSTIQYGLGFGGLAGGGFGLPVSDLFILEPGFSMQYYPVNLTGYPGYKPSFNIYVRILLGFSHGKVS